MLYWYANQVTQAHEELQKQAEKDHLAQEVIDEERKVNPRYNPTLAWVGRRIVDVGTKLVNISGSGDDKESLHHPDIHLN